MESSDWLTRHSSKFFAFCSRPALGKYFGEICQLLLGINDRRAQQHDYQCGVRCRPWVPPRHARDEPIRSQHDFRMLPNAAKEFKMKSSIKSAVTLSAMAAFSLLSSLNPA